MGRPKVSIGMPVYNGSDTLRQAIQSILDQSFSDFELIVSDNASSDDTQTIVRDFRARDERIRFFRQEENIGPIANFNFVLNQAKADCFMWAAADDLWDRNWVKTLLANMTEPVAISFGHVANIDSSGAVTRSYDTFNMTGSRPSRLARFFLAEELNGKANLIYGLYRTAFLREHPFGEYHGCAFGSDMHFVFDCLQYGEVVCDDSVKIYKRHEAGAPSSWSPGRIVNSLFMLNMLEYFSVYPRIATRASDKALLFLLLPVKYFKSLLFNLRRLAGMLV